MNSASDYANSPPFPSALVVPRGQGKITSALHPIHNGSAFFGQGIRSSIFNFAPSTEATSFGCMTFQGANGVRCSGSGIKDMAVFCGAMTGGNVFAVDFAQDWFLFNALVSGAYNLLSLRQAGGTSIEMLDAEQIRGSYGIEAYGTRVARNNSVTSRD